VNEKRRIPHGDTNIYSGLDRSSQGVFVSKNQTKVTYPLQPRGFRLSALPTPQDYQPHPLVPSLAASTMARSRGGTGNKNLNFKLGHYSILKIINAVLYRILPFAILLSFIVFKITISKKNYVLNQTF
jgi:hypothetical protein